MMTGTMSPIEILTQSLRVMNSRNPLGQVHAGPYSTARKSHGKTNLETPTRNTKTSEASENYCEACDNP